MGSWFSNIHIRKNHTATEQKVADCIREWIAAKQYTPCATEMDADGAVAIVTSEDC